MTSVNDATAVAAIPSDPGAPDLTADTVSHATGFDIILEVEAGTGKNGMTYEARVQVMNLTQFKLVAAAPATISGLVNDGVTWNGQNTALKFNVPAASADYAPGDLLQVIGRLRVGPNSAVNGDFSTAQSLLFEATP
jgi:hypothetical protein